MPEPSAGAAHRVLGPGAPELLPTRDPARSRDRLLAAALHGPERLRTRRQVLDLLDRHGASLADRTTSPGHLTASAVVVEATLERVAVLLHAKLRRWLQPGGHADGDHELAGVALREATEETGLEGLRVVVPAVDLDVHRVDHGDGLGAHLHLDLRFVVLAPVGAELDPNHESLDLRWVTADELGALSDEDGLVQLVRTGLEVAATVGRDPGG
jgi:8-oxo-dGTP pyrophosphatase MutT (NUDIX family)